MQIELQWLLDAGSRRSIAVLRCRCGNKFGCGWLRWRMLHLHRDGYADEDGGARLNVAVEKMMVDIVRKNAQMRGA
ncbi:hypothetical protein DEO72_LG3g618 [Vigna unguiculata]|uniref:Uncharacterized protein n=1 Tax=Vigna unguiculata TaxID=3917 RepID=A0A4D6LC17_VIGUN|nr:hypothetical protein DEO72_LG3g618 [Vigna unguiculata]